MAQQFFKLLGRVGQARTQLLAMSAASIGLMGVSDQRGVTVHSYSFPGFTPLALADGPPSVGQPQPQPASIALTGFEEVRDLNGFVTAVLQKTLKCQKNSPVQSMISDRTEPASSIPSGLSLATKPGPVPMDPAVFYSQLEKQPLSEKVLVLDDIVDSVIQEAQRSAELSGLTVGMLGGGLACYAVLGWWSDLAVPGVGTVACSALAGAAGHNRAKVAAKRTRTRLLTAILDAQPEGVRNSFVDYLSAPSLDVKQRIASETKPAVFFRDFYLAVQPLLKQVPGGRSDSDDLALSTAA